jgi:DNA-binding winged helix-turn-helix (wHTH) protein/tetratricopeptide (TPR) repeat protein
MQPLEQEPAVRYRFDRYVVDPQELTLLKDGTPVPLTRKTFETLLYLVRNPGRLISRQELLQAVWPDSFVEEGNLHWNISTLRKALGSLERGETGLIQTVHGAGYRFRATVEVETTGGPEPEPEPAVPVPEPLPPRLRDTATFPIRVSKPAPRPRRIFWIAGLALVAVLAGLAAWIGTRRSHSTAPGGPRKVIAVLGFRDLSARRETAWLATAFSEMIGADLSADGRVRPVSSEEVGRLQRELGMAAPQTLGAATLERVRKGLGADLVVVGSYLALEGGGQPVRLNLEVQDAGSGETVATIAEEGRREELFDLVARASDEVRGRLGLPDLSREDRRAVAATLSRVPEAARLYAEGLARLRAGDPLAAKDLLTRASIADPGFAPAHAALSEILAVLGEEEAAEREGLAALQSSAALPERERLEIEGGYRVLVHRWDEAIALYRKLWTKYPDQSEYGLALGRAQNQAGRYPDAFATVEEVRRTSPLRDARIDLLEAAVARAANDPQRMLKAAERAESTARAQGSGYLLAAAQLQQALAEYGLRDAAEAGRRVAAARRTAERIRSPDLGTQILRAEGSICLLAGDLDCAASKSQESLAELERQGNRQAQPDVLFALAYVLTMRGDLGRAANRCETALALCVAQRDLKCQARARTELGHIAFSQGEIDQAREHFEEARRIGAGVPDPYRESRNLEGLMEVAESLGDLPAAERWVREKLALDLRRQDARTIVKDEVNLAIFLNEQGKPKEGLEMAGRALGPASEPLPEFRAYAAGVAAESLAALGRLSEADAESRKAMGLLPQVKSVQIEVAVLFSRAEVLRSLRRFEEARKLAATVLARTRETRLEGWELETKLFDAKLTLDTGDRATAVRMLEDLESEARLKSDLGVARKARAARAGGGRSSSR